MALMNNFKHERNVKEFLRTNNLNEESLQRDNFKDKAILQKVRTSEIFDYFTQADVGLYGALNQLVNVKNRRLSPRNLQKLEQALVRAQRLQSRELKRADPTNKRQYQQYKQQLDTILLT